MKIIKTFLKKEFPKEEKIIYVVLGVWLIFLLITFILSSGFETKYEWLGKINPGTWGDSFGIINSLISIITFFLVYKTFSLQKEELELTKKELEGQQDNTKYQRIQPIVMDLIKMSDKHLEKFEQFLREIYTGWGTGFIKSYIANGNDLERHYDQKMISPLISYFKTLKYSEELILESFPDEESIFRKQLISLVKNQINLDIIKAYPKLKLHDPDFIAFDYLFSGSAFPEIFPNN